MALARPFGSELQQQRLTRVEHDQDAILQAFEWLQSAVQRRPQAHIEPTMPRAQSSPTFCDAVRALRQQRLKCAQDAHAKDTFKEAYRLAKQHRFDTCIARGEYSDAVRVGGVSDVADPLLKPLTISCPRAFLCSLHDLTQKASKSYPTSLFDDTNLGAIQAERGTMMDIQATRHVRGERSCKEKERSRL